MLSKVRRRHPSYGNVKARGRPRHGRPGAAPRLSQVRMCAGTCVGRKPQGPLGRGCEEPGGSAGRSSALPPRRTQAAWTFSRRTPPRPGRAGPGVSLHELACSGCLRPGVTPGGRRLGRTHSAQHACTFTEQPLTRWASRAWGEVSTHTSFPASSVLSVPGRRGHCLSLGDEGII